MGAVTDHLRFAALSLASLALFCVARELLLHYSPLGPVTAGACGCVLAVAAVLGSGNLSHLWGGTWKTPRKRALQTILVVSLLMSYSLSAVLLVHQPLLQPLAALVLASAAAMAFSFFGYSRLVFRR